MSEQSMSTEGTVGAEETARRRAWGQRDPELPPRRAVVVVASTRAAAGTYQDTAGPAGVAMLREAGVQCPDPIVVADGEPLRRELQRQLRDLPEHERPDLLVTSGGTGVMIDDRTPETTAPLLDLELPGLMHAIWAAGLEHVQTAVLSRGCAGVSGRTLVVNLPGSRGGVKDGMGVLIPLLEHVLHQLEGDRESGHTQPEPARPADGFQPSGAQGDHPVDLEPSVVVDAWVTDQPLDPIAFRALVSADTAGAVVAFSGIVRDHDAGRSVTALEYTAHPSAAAVLAEVCAEIAAEQPGLRIAAAHRIGPLQVGDSALEVAVAASHRKAAFQICDALVDRIKDRVPIWKEQHLTGGAREWVNL